MTQAENIEKVWRTPPARTSERRDKGMGKLSLHAKKRGDGKSQDYRAVKVGKKTVILWRFTLRTVHGSKTFWADGWLDAERLSGGYEVELAKEAEAATAEVEQEAKKIETRTVNDLCDHFLKVKSADNCSTREPTVKGYECEFKRFIRKDPLGTLRVVEVTPEHIDEWINRHASAKAGKARTRQKRVILLGSLFRLGVNDGWRGASPVLKRHHVPVRKEGDTNGKLKGDQRVAKPLSMDELAAVVGNLDPDDDALRLLVEVTGKIGLRVREATHVRLDDVDLDRADGTAFIRVVNGRPCACRDCRENGGVRLNKASRERFTPVPPDLVDACRRHANTVRARFGPRSWFFPVWRAKPRQRSRPGDLRVATVVSGAFTAATEAAGLTDRVFHDLRATAKTWLLVDLGANEYAVNAALGHTQPGAMTETYVKLQNPVLFYQRCFPAWVPPKPALVREAKTA